MPSAARLAAELRDAFGIEARLIKGRGGIFDVIVDGHRVFSKHETYRFPDDGEVTDLIRARGNQ